MKDIVIVGASGFGKEVAWLIEDINKVNEEWNLLGFIDDDLSKIGSLVYGYPVLGNLSWLENKTVAVVIAIGNSEIRAKIAKSLERLSITYATLIHPSVITSKSVNIGTGSIVCAGNIVTVDINIGNHVIINLDCTVGHDAILSDFVTVYPSVNISGNVTLNKGIEVGTGAQIIQGVTIGENTIIGAGSVVVKEIPSNCTAVGIPAKVIKQH